MKSVGVFADVNNQFFAALSTFHGQKINYAKYLERAVGDRELYRALAYGVQMADEATPFITYLQKVGFEVRYKQARMFNGKLSIRDTDWNIGIAMDIMRHLDRLDIVVIGSNDYRLAPLIDFIRERGVKVIVLACRIPNELYDSADQAIEITEDLIDCKGE